MFTKRLKIPNRKFIVHARMGASLVIAKVWLNVTSPPRASDRSVIRPMIPANLVWIGNVGWNQARIRKRMKVRV